jgi:hypothetical protein
MVAGEKFPPDAAGIKSSGAQLALLERGPPSATGLRRRGYDAARGQGIRMITPQGVWWTMGVHGKPVVSGGVDARLATHVSVGMPRAQAA